MAQRDIQLKIDATVGAQELLSQAEITTMEIAGPKEFLNKWNLKIIK